MKKKSKIKKAPKLKSSQKKTASSEENHTLLLSGIEKLSVRLDALEQKMNQMLEMLSSKSVEHRPQTSPSGNFNTARSSHSEFVQPPRSSQDSRFNRNQGRVFSRPNSQQPQSHQNQAPNQGGQPPRGGRAMFQAVCTDCGKNCEVPFKPTGERPTYCKECFAVRKSGKGGFQKNPADHTFAQTQKRLVKVIPNGVGKVTISEIVAAPPAAIASGKNQAARIEKKNK